MRRIHRLMAAGVLGGGNPYPNVVLYDKFTAANGTNLNGRLADTVSNGNAWAVTAGAFDIQGNESNAATVAAAATIQAGISDLKLTIDFHLVTDGTSSMGVIFRRVNATNYWLVTLKASTTDFNLVELNAGTPTTRATKQVAGANTGTHTVVITALGDSIIATLDGANDLTYTSTLHQTATICGISANILLQKHDNFKVESLFSYGISGFADDAYPAQIVSRSDAGTYHLTSPAARVVFSTEAETAAVETYNDIYGTYPGFSDIGVRIDGADGTAIEPGALATVTKSVALGSGLKTVEFINGLQSKPGADVIGSFVCGVTFNKVATKINPVSTPRLLIYGDSIAVGGNATNPSLQGWAQLVRDAYTGSMLLEAWGSRTLNADGATAGARTTFTAHIAAQNPAIIWLAIGTNDYALQPWSAADFGVAYADLLDKLHTALPSAVIYAQTPITRVVETANTFGDTTGAYRTQIANAQSTRSAYCNLVDGTAWTITLDDNVHPSTAGHAQYAAYVKTALGIP